HAVKKDTRYRYYVSRPLITKGQTERSTGLRIPAGEIEQTVAGRARQWLLDPGSLYQATRLPDPSAQRRLVARAAEIGKSWPELPATRRHAHRGRGRPDRHPFARDTARCASRCRYAIAERDRRRNPDPVRADPAALRRAGDHDADRGRRPVWCSKTRCAADQAADQSAPLQYRARWRRRHGRC